jgi:hypothetical protein
MMRVLGKIKLSVTIVQGLPKKAKMRHRKPKTENRKPALTLPGESDKVAYR